MISGRPEPSSSSDPAVHMAFGDTPDYVLRGAVSFVEEIGGIKLVLATDIHTSSPLLVFCKNDTKLQEDIRHAVENTRSKFKTKSLQVKRCHHC